MTNTDLWKGFINTIIFKIMAILDLSALRRNTTINRRLLNALFSVLRNSSKTARFLKRGQYLKQLWIANNKILSHKPKQFPFFLLDNIITGIERMHSRVQQPCEFNGTKETVYLKRGYTRRLFWRRLTRDFCQYLGHVSSDAKSPCLFRFCVNFWVIFGHFGKEIFFLKG